MTAKAKAPPPKKRSRFGCLIDVVIALAMLGLVIGMIDSAFGNMNNSLPSNLQAPKPWYPGNDPNDPSTPNPMLTSCPKGYTCNGQIPGHAGPTVPASGSGSSGSTSTFTPFPATTVTVTVTIPPPSPKP